MNLRAALLGALLALPSMLVADEAPLPDWVVIGGVEFVRIPAGAFWYTVGAGNPDAMPVDAPQFRDVRIWLDDFYIARYEASAADLGHYLNASGAIALPPRVAERSGDASPPLSCSFFRDDDGLVRLPEPFAADAKRPATNLSWELADGFARWMGFRLPTEAEWTKAARGADDRRLWPWGDGYPDDTYGYFGVTATLCHPAPIDGYPKGRSPYGLHHMAGNVAEWVVDWYSLDFDARLGDGMRNPVPASEGSLVYPLGVPQRILKGGRWSAGTDAVTIIWRGLYSPDYFNQANGVRFALDAAEVRRRLPGGSVQVSGVQP